MTYMQKKALIVQNFGVAKAKRATASLITNKVNDDGVTNKDGKGARDESLLSKAKQQHSEKEAQAAKVSKKQKFSFDAVFPEEILGLISYKQTFEALQAGDKEKLSKLLSAFARISMENAYSRFEHIESKREKKQLMKAHVFLDALLTLQRLPNHISRTLEDLSEKVFKGLDVEAVRAIVEKFCDLQHIPKNEFKQKQQSQPVDVKFVKTKDKQKTLLAHIIAAAMHLSSNKRMRASVFSKTLKKEVHELKNYFKEVGLGMEATKHEPTGEPDIMLHLPGAKRDHKDQEQAAGEVE